MKKLILIGFLIFLISSNIVAERYEPVIGKSGSVLDAGFIRFLFGWLYNENDSINNSCFNFGIDFGTGAKTELQNRIDYNSSDSGNYEWIGWTELIKIRLSEIAKGPAYSLGLGVRIPVRKTESLGLIAGLFISSGIKDIDFDFNIGFNPYFIYKDMEGYKERPNHFVNVDLLLGYKLLPFLKIDGGFEMKQFLTGSRKDYNIATQEYDQKSEIPGGSSWAFIIGGRIKPLDYPVLFDTGISFGTGKNYEYDWQFKLGVQILPQSPEAEW